MEEWYEPIDIAELGGGVLQGYSAVLNLNWRWEEGRLGCHDPATGEHIVTYDDLLTDLDQERNRADQEREARVTAEAGREAAEARVRELEARLRQQSS